MFFNFMDYLQNYYNFFSCEITSETINKPKFRQLQVSLN